MSKINNDFINIDFIKKELKEVYSTNEVKTNKVWIDNKPIYRKCFAITMLNQSGTQSIQHNISKLDTFTSITGIIKNPSYPSATRPLPLSDPTTTNNVRIDSSTGSINIKQGADWSGYTGYIIAEYTKTTD